MHLELALDPADATRLTRHRAIAARRGPARARSHRVRWVWHDTPDTSLAAEGLALVERGGAFRLERVRSNGVAVTPGVAALALEEPTDPALLPGPLVPVMAFEGRELSFALDTAGPRLTLLRGTLRAVAGLSPVCRLSLDGPEMEVLALARAVAADLRVTVPGPLSTEAVGTGSGTSPTPAVPPLGTGMTVGDAFAAILGHQTELLLRSCARVGPDTPADVHQARVAVRRARSALTLFRRVTDTEPTRTADEGLRVLGRLLGAARDWDVFRDGIGAAVANAFGTDAGVRGLGRAADRARAVAYRAVADHFATASFRLLTLDLVALAGGTGWTEAIEPERKARLSEPVGSFAADMLDRRLANLAEAGEGIEDLSAEALHAVRLRAKRLRYACEFFAPLYDGHRRQARRFVSRLAVLQDRLGAVNDAEVSVALLRGLPRSGPGHAEASGIVRGYAASRATEARPRALRAWARFRQRKPFWT